MRAKTMFYVCAVMTCVNALVSAGFSLAMLTSQSSAHVAAMYGVARSVPLAIAALVTMGKRSYGGVMVLAPLLGSIQACDAIVGRVSHDVGKAIRPSGPAADNARSADIGLR